MASKVWIQLIKIKVYIFPPYFTHKIKTLFWTPSKMGVLKYLTFVSQINVMTQKIKHKNCTKMIKFILKILVIKWCKEYIILLCYVTDHKSNSKEMRVHFFCWMKFRFTWCRTWGTSGKFGFGCTTEPDERTENQNKSQSQYKWKTCAHLFLCSNKKKRLTLGHEGFAGLVASIALLDEVLGHPVGPGWREGVLWCFIVLP